MTRARDAAERLLLSIRTRTSSVKKPSYWTVQVFPAGSGSSRAYRLSPRTLMAAGAALVVALGLGAAAALGFLGHRHAISELERYRAENEHLVASLRSMEARTDRLSHALDGLAARDQRFRLVAGLPLLDDDVYSVGIGGPSLVDPEQDRFSRLAPAVASQAEDVNVELDQLLRRAELLSASLSEAADSVEDRRDTFERRPTIYPVLADNSWISSSYSFNRLHPVLGYRRPHPGIDISAPLGSPVLAAGAGRVVEAGAVSGYGKLVEVDHGDGYRTRYAHLASISVRRGQTVQRGSQLGEVGRSGVTTGPNLHYEIWIDGRQVNPREYLLDRSFRR